MNSTQVGTKDFEVKTTVTASNPPVEWVREQIEKAGTKIGSVHFTKRENGELRKMCYRLHVKKPSVAKAPKGISLDSVTTTATTSVTPVAPVATKEICSCGKERGIGPNQCNQGPFKVVPVDSKAVVTVTPASPVAPVKVDKKVIDKANNQITVLDANKVVRSLTGEVIGRGAWRTIPLENVVRIVNNKVEYVINRS